MIIYATPFNAATLKVTGPSSDSGYTDFDQVVAILGEPDVRRSKNTLIYGPGNDRVIFTKFKFGAVGDERPA